MSTTKTLLLSLAILAGAGAVTALIFMTEPEAERSGAVRESAMLVEVTGVQRGTYRPVIRAMGTVEPSRDITLAPRVSGQILTVSENFTPGGYVEAGDPLLQIDPADYRNALAQRRSDLSQALTDLALEEGRQDVARQDYALLGDTLSAEDRALVLREPQLEAARARVEAARAAVEQAELELERTTIRAPFDAHVLTRTANVGSQVSVGEALGRLVGMDTYWVVATVPQSRLRWLSFPGDGPPSAVRVRNRTAWEPGEARAGTLHRLVGALEGRTRLARVLVDVPDPLARETDAPPLMIGSFVEAHIESRPLTDVIRLDRDYVRDDATVWVMADSVLRIREVDIVFEDAEYAYIAGGLDSDARVVTTNLSTVVDGAPLRVTGSDTGRRTAGPRARSSGPPVADTMAAPDTTTGGGSGAGQ